MTILIVDDEWYAVKGLSEGIDWEQCGISCVLEAYSAEEAMEAMRSHQVDIMICDIEMPEMNGLELVRWSVENYPHTRIIFLTAHASFPYANEAVRLHAFDYILKPVDYDRLIELVNDARVSVRADHEQRENAEKWKEYHDKMVAQRPERMRRFWYNVINSRLNRDSIYAWLSGQEDRVPGKITPLAIWMDTGDNSTQEENVLTIVLEEKLDEYVLGRYYGHRIDDPEMDSLLLIYTASSVLADKLDPVLKAIESELDVKLQWAYGEASLPETLWWTVRKLRSVPQRMESGTESPESIDWEYAMINLPIEELHKRIDKLFADILASKRSARFHAEVLRILGSMMLLVDRYGLSDITAEQIRDCSRSDASTAETLNALHGLLDICTMEINACHTTSNALISQCRQYIRTHLSQELTRESIAAHVYLHPVYLSRLFKSEMGITLSDYIAEERVRTACRLLATYNIKIGSIAAQVGISPFSYFCRVFRRITGMSPQEYRQRILAEPGSVKLNWSTEEEKM